MHVEWKEWTYLIDRGDPTFPVHAETILLPIWAFAVEVDPEVLEERRLDQRVKLIIQRVRYTLDRLEVALRCFYWSCRLTEQERLLSLAYTKR